MRLNSDQIYVYNITDERLDDVIGVLDGIRDLVGEARGSGRESQWVAYEDALNAIDGLAGLLTYLYSAVEEEMEVMQL